MKSDGCIISWWRNQMEPFSALLAICAGNSPVPGEFPAQRPVTRSFDVFFDLRLNKRLSKQSWGWWFETLSRPLWRHCMIIFSVETPQGIYNFSGIPAWLVWKNTIILLPTSQKHWKSLLSRGTAAYKNHLPLNQSLSYEYVITRHVPFSKSTIKSPHLYALATKFSPLFYNRFTFFL